MSANEVSDFAVPEAEAGPGQPAVTPRSNPVLQGLLVFVQVVLVLAFSGAAAAALYVGSLFAFGADAVAGVLGVVGSYGTKALRTAPAQAQFGFFLLVSALFLALLAGALLTALIFGRKSWWAPMALARPVWMPPAWGIALFVIAMPLYLAAASATIRFFYPDFSTWFFVPRAPAAMAVSFLAVVVLAPLAEEFLFRGWIYTGLRKAFGMAAAIVVTTLLFAFAHSDGGLIYPAAIMIPGLALTLVRESTGSTWMSFAAHATYNAWAWLLVLALGESL